MKTYQSPQPAQTAVPRNTTRSQHPAQRPSVAKSVVWPSHSAVIQRKCACGGSCPDCKNESVQKALKISEPGDRFEREAESVASQVMSGGPVSQPAQHTQPNISRKEQPSPGKHSAQNQTSTLGLGSGMPMSARDQRFFNDRFGHDFSHVRIHNDSRAHHSAERFNAKAYTTGNHIAFGSGQYQPGSTEGRHLMAHELTHVVQQNGGQAAGEIQRVVSNDYSRGNDDASECDYETARVNATLTVDTSNCSGEGVIPIYIDYVATLAGNPRDLQPVQIGPRGQLVEVGSNPVNRSANLTHTTIDPPAGPPGDTLTGSITLAQTLPCEGGSTGGTVNLQFGNSVQQTIDWQAIADRSGVQSEQISVTQQPIRMPMPLRDLTAGQAPYPNFPGNPRSGGTSCDPNTGQEQNRTFSPGGNP